MRRSRLTAAPRGRSCCFNPFCCEHLRKSQVTEAPPSISRRLFCAAAQVLPNNGERRVNLRGQWADVKMQRQFLEGLEKKLGIKEADDWYRVKKSELLGAGFPSSSATRRGLARILEEGYPDVSWDSTRFFRSNAGSNKTHLLAALDNAAQKLGIQEPSDWYSSALSDLRAVGFPSHVKRVQLAELLQERHPEVKWERLFLLRGRFAQQMRLQKIVASLFPNEQLLVNARKEAGLINVTGDYLELDIYLPSLNLAFEYQERHHYISTGADYKPLVSVKQRDTEKKKLAKEKGIALVIVPCWWDGTRESLVATLRQQRPELILHIPTNGVAPIAEQPPPRYFDKQIYQVEDIGEITSPCFFKLSDINPTSWWMFEKYDGVRGFWNPLKKKFYSRHGRVIPLPERIIDAMPTDIFLDGELWFGRDRFQESMKLSYRGYSGDIDWNNFKYMVFDIPNHSGTYEESYNSLVERFGSNQQQGREFLQVAQRTVCSGVGHMEAFFQDVMNKGGEGIILRNPKTTYQPGRSPNYLKHKKFRDAEAKIVGPAGWHRWECELPNGVRFTGVAGTVEFAEKVQPKEGDIVSFKHRGFLFATQKPKLPTLYRVRTDITWENVVNNWKEQKPSVSLADWNKKPVTNKPREYWRDVNNCRLFFDEFAREKGFDPLSPKEWYTNWNQLKKKKGCASMAREQNGLKSALQRCYPELRFAEWRGISPLTTLSATPTTPVSPSFSAWV